jgi:hypothetical protein
MTIVVLCIYRLADSVVLLIAWLSALPSDKGMALRGKICLYVIVGRSIVEAELCELVKDPDASGLAFLRYEITERYVVVADTEFNIESVSLSILECDHSLCNFVFHLRCLGTVYGIITA